MPYDQFPSDLTYKRYLKEKLGHCVSEAGNFFRHCVFKGREMQRQKKKLKNIIKDRHLHIWKNSSEYKMCWLEYATCMILISNPARLKTM